MSVTDRVVDSRVVAIFMLAFTGALLVVVTHLVALVDPAGERLLYQIMAGFVWLSFGLIIVRLVILQWRCFASLGNDGNGQK